MKTKKGIKILLCDLCGSAAAIEVPHCREYTNNQPVHICKNCGFVHVKERRPAKEIAKAWSYLIFDKSFTEKTYTSRIPAVKARHVYVADFINENIGLKRKYVCDIGAGEGQFLEIVSDSDYKAKVFGIEPSEANCRAMRKSGFKVFRGTIEDFRNSDEFAKGTFDVVTIIWTLCNSFSCRDMVSIAHEMLKRGGYLVIAEGSRIGVPFKKPLNYYFSSLPQDLHSFHFSANALRNLFQISGFEVVHVNRYVDTDYLCMIGKKTTKNKSKDFKKDNYRVVRDFFERWHRETPFYKSIKNA